MAIAVQSAYQESSQYRRWTLSEEELARRRAHVNASTISTIKQHIEEETALSGKAPERVADFPTTEESLLVVNYYASKVFETGSVFGFPSHLKATAATYLKRFYLVKSPLQYHPKNIMMTSLFLATKTCEYHVNLEDFIEKVPKFTMEGVLEYEFLVSSTISFDFVHWSPYRPLYGFVLDMEALAGGSNADSRPVGERGTDDQQQHTLSDYNRAHDAAKVLINACMWSDLGFTCSPSHIALAALHLVLADQLKVYLERKDLSSLLPLVVDISQRMAVLSHHKFDTNVLKKVDRKIYYASDPAMKKDSALYKRGKAEEEARESEKRQAKGDGARNSQLELGSMLA